MKFRIDGVEIPALPEDTIMAAARRADVFIPGLCYYEPTGGNHSCRLCMVEVEENGRIRLVAACAYLVREGMTVTTTTERVATLRRTLLKLLYLQAPESPVVAELMERCGVEAPQTEAGRPGSLSKKDHKTGLADCILCGRCAEACAALGNAAISAVSRGVDKRVDTPYSQASDVCIGCASCAEACPMGIIKAVDTDEGRNIWNKDFNWIRCEECGAIISTELHYWAMQGNLAAKEATAPERALCPVCRRKAITGVFAASLGE